MSTLTNLGGAWILTSGFVHFFRPKIQGLFKDFQGPNFEISRTSFLFTSKNLPMEIVWQYNSCSFSVMKMRENNAKTLVTILNPTACRVCMPWLEWLTIFTEVMRVRKNSRTFKDQEWRAKIFKDFQGLENVLSIFKGFQGFSRRVEPCHISPRLL